MKKALLSLALALVAVPSAFAATAQVGGGNMPPVKHGPFFVAEAYGIALEADYGEGTIPCRKNPDGSQGTIAPNSRWIGDVQGDTNSRAVGGVLSLAENADHTLNTDVFATCPGDSDAFVQSFRLIKKVPGSRKCPNTYKPDTFFQFGSEEVRTWWTLIYTQPKTTFTLELIVVCQDTLGRPTIHTDIWIWEVVATIESLLNVIDVLHTGALGLTEIPCISAEDVYAELFAAVEAIDPSAPRQTVQNALFDAEALLLSFCCFVDCFIPEDVFSANFPPGNGMQFGTYGFTGIIDTIENPCCCKILVDLEFIGECYGIVSA